MLKFNHLPSRLIVKSCIALSLFVAAESQANMCGQVWTGTVERVRVQEQATGETVLRAYIAPGHNVDGVGYTSSKFMVDTLLKGKAKNAVMTGYTDDSCKIIWVDFR